MSSHTCFPRFDAGLAPAAGRRKLVLSDLRCAPVNDNERVCEQSAVITPWKISSHDAPWPKNMERRLSIAAATQRQRRERLAYGRCSDESSTWYRAQIPVTQQKSHWQKQISVSSGYERAQFVFGGADLERYRNVGEVKVLSELPGSSTRQGAGVTFVRSCVQMFGYVTNWSLFGRQRLFHQKTREHGSGSFVQPLFEKSVDFLFQVGRVIQSGKFKGLERGNCCLLQVLPRRANTSGTHLRVSLNRYGSDICIPYGQ
jgi:hypothetical protein